MVFFGHGGVGPGGEMVFDGGEKGFVFGFVVEVDEEVG